MEGSVNLELKGGLSFEAEVDGHKLMIDSGEKFGGQNRGPRPKNLMMVALAGCTGMDVASIMGKMKIPFEGLNVEVKGSITEDHPKHFENMHIIYKLTGKNIMKEKVEKAVNLSLDKYCGVSFGYKKSMKISYEIIINE